MDFLSNEFLFYGGIVLAAGALVVLVIYLFISKIGAIRLDIKLDSEYGKKIERNKS
jgi:hypothetical protein